MASYSTSFRAKGASVASLLKRDFASLVYDPLGYYNAEVLGVAKQNGIISSFSIITEAPEAQRKAVEIQVL